MKYKIKRLAEILTNTWNSIIDVIDTLVAILSCFIVYGSVIFVGYYLFREFDVQRVIVGCIVACVMIYVNSIIQGRK